MTTAELAERPAKTQTGRDRAHLAWTPTARVGFCGAPCGHREVLRLSEVPAGTPICPACLAIYRIWQRSGTWEGL